MIYITVISLRVKRTEITVMSVAGDKYAWLEKAREQVVEQINSRFASRRECVIKLKAPPKIAADL